MLTPWQKLLVFTKALVILLLILSLGLAVANFALPTNETFVYAEPYGWLRQENYFFGRNWFLAILGLMAASIVLLMYDELVNDEQQRLRTLKAQWEVEQMEAECIQDMEKLHVQAYGPTNKSVSQNQPRDSQGRCIPFSPN